MHWCSTLIASFVFVAAVLTAPHGHPLPELLVRDNYAVPYAGSFISKGPGTFQTVAGSLALPAISGNPGSVISFMLGIDGLTCPSTSFYVGVTCTPGTCCTAWTDIGSQPLVNYTIELNPGDIISFFVRANSPTSGATFILNESNGQQAFKTWSISEPLCMQDAGWIVMPGEITPTDFTDLSTFRSVTFKGAKAVDHSGTVFGITDGNLSSIIQEGSAMTNNTKNDRFSLTVSYV